MKKIISITAILVAVAGCGGSSDGSGTGVINIGITDAAVDNVDEVWVEFSSITLKPASGDEIVETFDPPKQINLFELQNGNTASLLPDTRVPVGRYNWMRLGVNADFDTVMDSYVVMTTGEQLELRIPSGSQTGLKLVSGYTVTQDQSTNLIIDWDLRKALSDPDGQPGLHLRPALRVTDTASYGTLSGSVAESLTMEEHCGDDSSVGNAVYVYDGFVEEPDDIQSIATDPVVTASVDVALNYSVTYLSVGEYTVAFTCQSDQDVNDEDNEIIISPVLTGVIINDNETTTADFASSP